MPVIVTAPRTGYGLDKIPPAASSAMKKAVVIEGLAEDQFFSPVRAASLRKPYVEGAEDAFIAQLHSASGNIVTGHDIKGNKPHYQSIARNALREIFRKAAILQRSATSKQESLLVLEPA